MESFESYHTYSAATLAMICAAVAGFSAPAHAHNGDTVAAVCDDARAAPQILATGFSVSINCAGDGRIRIRVAGQAEIVRAQLFLDPAHDRQLDRPMQFVWRPGSPVQVAQEQHQGIANATAVDGGLEWIISLPGVNHRTIGFGLSLDTESGELTWPATVSKDLNRRRLGDLLFLGPGQQTATISGQVDWDGTTTMAAPNRIVALSAYARVEGPVTPEGQFQFEVVPGEYRLFPLDSRMAGRALDSIPVSVGSGRSVEISNPITALVAEGAIENLVPDILEAANVKAASVSVIRSGELVFSRSFGIEADGDPAGPDTLFDVESITKTVTAMTLLSLAEQGQLDLDERLDATWIDPDVQEDPRHSELTYRIVLRHLTALPNWRGEGNLEFLGEPGHRQQYSGEGFEYVRRALERRFDRSLESLAKEYVFEPAGTSNMSYLRTDESEAHSAGAHYGDYFFGDEEPTGAANAAAGLVATSSDLATYARWLANGAGLSLEAWMRILTPNDVTMLESQADTPLGEGFFVFDQAHSGQLPVFGHGGSGLGSKSMLVVDPKRRDAVVISTSSGGGLAIIRAVIEAAFKRGTDYPDLESELALSEASDY